MNDVSDCHSRTIFENKFACRRDIYRFSVLMTAIWKFNPDITANRCSTLFIEMAKIFSTLPSREELLEGCKKCRENQIPIKS
jgi:hypothetical protein